ncbi:MAG TPA: 16S rRNA (guanine(966)-N(2))-methyltransferase RsmD [Rhodospirillaceae bacterium]|nr:16S rRNA (guanine(966)-N(2))-methyltransferase RsmD [Rhodospirillaceae bacterium]
MRITGGTHRTRPLRAPEGLITRPTTDRIREALFNILSHRDWGADLGKMPESQIVLDAFAGTGALGLEALSRGGSQTIFFEKNRKSLKLLEENICSLKLEEQSTIHALDVTHPLEAETACSLIFLDPPYHKDLIPQTLAALEETGWIAPHALIVTETAKGEAFEIPPFLQPLLERRYGNTVLTFLEKK